MPLGVDLASWRALAHAIVVSTDENRSQSLTSGVTVRNPCPRLLPRSPIWPVILLGVFAAAVCGTARALEDAGPRYAIAMHGEPALPQGFTHFPYANPAAPKGGRLVLGMLGTFDSLNPFIIKGIAPQTMRGSVINNYVVEPLMARGYNEPFTLYGLLAQSVETDAQRSYVTFTLNPKARFSDGTPVTPQDVLFSWRLLRDKGRPNHRLYYSKVVKAEIVGQNAVRFDLGGSHDRELPLILGLMSVLPKHATNPDTFEETSFKPMIGSGPYVIADVEPGKSITLKRDPGYWGRDLPVNRGLWNFDEIRFDYYRDADTHFEAFKRGLYDVRVETDSTRWASGYNFPALRQGRVVKTAVPTALPKPSFYFVFNTRRSLFADVRVREAISLLYDFKWTNRNLFFGLYGPVAGYFEGSELSAHGRPADARERALLAPFPGAVRPDVLDGTWSPPVTDGSGRDRPTLHRAIELFTAAGYTLRGGRLVSRASGKPFTFEILVTNRDDERLALLFAQAVKRAGITVSVRSVDPVQYDQRRITYDFDMILFRWDQSLSPGNEQLFYFSSAAAKAEGTRNYMGVKSPAADAMIAAMLKAKDRADFVSAVRALDRVLISGFYTVPLFDIPNQWVAYWTYIGHPKTMSLYGFLPETWWRQPATP
jgi:peptide/nickel transport system substrate-binding protein